jgi:hypothetical protein
MRRIVLIILITLCVCAGLTLSVSVMAQKGSSEAAFRVTPVQNTFTQGEAVELQIQLTNTGRTALIVDGNMAMGASVHPHVTDPQDQAIDWNSSFDPGQSVFQTLAPGGSLTRIVCLNCGVRNPFSSPFGTEGDYTAQLEYDSSGAAAQTANFPGAVPLSQNLTAAPIHFQISPAAVAFTAQPTQPVFHVGDPINFQFHLQNHSKVLLLTAYDLALNGSVRLRVLDADGHAVAWTGQPGNTTSILSTVAAGSSIDSAYPITPTNLFGTVVAGCDIREPGTYTAYAVYVIPESFNVLRSYVGVLPMLIVPGPIPAPPVKFTVKAASATPASGE